MPKKKQPKVVAEAAALLAEAEGGGDDPRAWIKEILPEEDIEREALRPLLQRRRIRYLLYRLQAEAAEDKPRPDLPEGFEEFFESQKWFDGWGNFAVTWDVGDPMDEESRGSADPFEVLPRYMSVWEEWDEEIEAHVKADTISSRKRARAKKMDDANGSEDNLRRDES